MKIQFVAGFGPIVADMTASRRFYAEALGIAFEGEEDYPHTDDLDGVRAFALWRLSDAAKSCFGTDAWPADLPVPQAWLEFDVESAEAVGEAAAELEGRGYRLLRPTSTEEWGQTVARLQSPEGLLVGVTFTPWMHPIGPTSGAACHRSSRQSDRPPEGQHTTGVQPSTRGAEG